jgi:dihydrolipoamide dehydrogenase
MSNNQYNVIVIGAGPGGYVAAIRASQLGLKTAIVEKEYMGGVCLNVGCIPSKALLKNADLAHTLSHRADEFGISFDGLKLDFEAAVKRSRKVSERLTKGIDFLMKKNKIDVFRGEAHLAKADTVAIKMDDGSDVQLTTDNIILATGAHSMQIPGWDVDGESIVTYKEAILQTKQPKSVVIIGAGAIGAEFATVWSSYGTDVTIVEMLPHLLPQMEQEAAGVLAKAFKKRKINVMTDTRVEAVEKTTEGVAVKVSNSKGEQVLEAEQALIAIGFRPNSANLGLEALGVEMDKRGFVQVDERMATNVPGIWAIGDVTGKMLLAHVASAMGTICAENIAGVETITLDYTMMPSAVYSHPQVAGFGLSEEKAKENGHEIKVGKFSFMANGKALGLGEAEGFVKIIEDAETGEILGASMAGPDVSELLPELNLAQRMELTSEEIARTVHAHPTLSEVLMEAAHGVHGTPVHG